MEQQPQKKLYRTRNAKIAGVCGGLAEYLGLDVALVRLLWVLTIFLGGGGVVAYLLAWIIIPQEPFDGAMKARISLRSEGDVCPSCGR
jgi:phage shock protein C